MMIRNPLLHFMWRDLWGVGEIAFTLLVFLFLPALRLTHGGKWKPYAVAALCDARPDVKLEVRALEPSIEYPLPPM